MNTYEFSLKISQNFVPEARINNIHYPSIGLDYGLVPTRRQAIIWTNEGYFTDAYTSHSVSMS